MNHREERAGLLRVLHAPTEGIDEAAHRCVGALWDRGWEGDADLAAGLEAALGSGPVPLLRRPVYGADHPVREVVGLHDW
jgi:hypothetical protein